MYECLMYGMHTKEVICTKRGLTRLANIFSAPAKHPAIFKLMGLSSLLLLLLHNVVLTGDLTLPPPFPKRHSKESG